jgi:hypothetical protein
VPGTRADGPARAAVDAVVAALVAAGHTVVRRDRPITAGAAGGVLARWAAAAADDAEHLGIRSSTSSRAAAPTPGSDAPCEPPGWSVRAPPSGSASG